MNTHPDALINSETKAGVPGWRWFGRGIALGALLVMAAGLLSGCANLKQYSIDSWEGPMPMHDLVYVQGDP